MASLLFALCGATGALAQNWQEETAALPSGLSRDNGIVLDIRGGSELRHTLDPRSVTVGADGVVRYVVRATSRSGTENALFEGIRCETGETTTYGRWDSLNQRWLPQSPRTWRPLSGPATSRVAHHLAQSGMCAGRAPNTPISTMLADLERGGRLIGDQR